MDISRKLCLIIYDLLFIFAKLCYCIDVSNGTVTATETVESVVEESSNTSSNTTEINSSNQTTKFDSTIQPPENGDAIQICNRTYPTPKGTVCRCASIYTCMYYVEN